MPNKNTIRSFDELWEILGDELPRQTRRDDSATAETAQTDAARPQEPVHIPDAAPDAPPPAEADSAENVLPVPGEQPDEVPEPEAPQLAPLDTKAYARLDEIRKYASWSYEDGEKKLNSLLVLFHEEYPGNEEAAERAVDDGRYNATLFQKAYDYGISGKSDKDLHKILCSLRPNTPRPVKDRIRKEFDRGTTAFRKRIAEVQRKKSGKPLSAVRLRQPDIGQTIAPRSPVLPRRKEAPVVTSELHPNDIRSLRPTARWQLIIDETGDQFDETAHKTSSKHVGRFVGILVPSDRPVLDPLSAGWHAVDVPDPAEIDAVMQKLLDAPAGVFGVDVRSVPITVGERWMDGVALLIDWVLRLMPVEDSCNLNVRVEQRGVFKGGQTWDLVRRDILRRLALAFPNRAARIDLDIQTIAKTANRLDGYADAVAFTWARTSDSSKARLRQSGLLGTCLLDSDRGIDARVMLNAWDAFAQGIRLPPPSWWDMVASSDARNAASLLSAFLDRVGEEARETVSLWQFMLNEVKRRMSATPVDLRRLAGAIDWLQRYQPDDAAILPALRLVWLTVQLARANHLGETERKWQAELEQLGDRLFDEAAPLVCHADLHRAVAATNRFDFESAGQALTRWRDCPPSVPGLRYWGQIQSSLGQHAAFLGDNVKAVAFFQTAMEAFGRLSDPDARERDLSQTGCYMATAQMDDATVPAQSVRKAVERIVGALPEAAECQAAGDDPSARYAHHLLLRWLVHRGDASVWNTYLNRRADWKTGDGHPWPLIQLYRGMLLRKTDPDAAVKLALDGAERALAANQGPTVRVIGACCRAVAAAWGTPWPEGEKELASLKHFLPAAESRIDRLNATLQSPEEPLALLQGVLPFNFR